MTLLALLTAVLSVAAPAEAPSPERRVAVTSRITLQVPNQAVAADTIIEAAALEGGYLVALDEQAVRVKVPTGALKRLRERVETLGIVLERSYRAEDVGRRIDEISTRAASRRKVIAQYFEVLATAGAKSVVAVERQIAQMVRELELMQGELRLLRHRIAYGELRVDFRAVDRRAPVRTTGSSFPWIDTVNLTDLYGEFRRAR